MAEKGQKDKQRSTKHTHKTKDRVTRTSLKLNYPKEMISFVFMIEYDKIK
jgi:hypothetical protein